MKKSKFDNKNYKSNIISTIKNILFKLTSQTVKKFFTSEEVVCISKKLERLVDDVDCATGTGKEDVMDIAFVCMDNLKTIDEVLVKGYKTIVFDTLSNLESSVNKYCAILNGDYLESSSQKSKDSKILKIEEKLNNLEEKANLVNKYKIGCYEKLTTLVDKKEEMETMLINATNQEVERLIYRDIQSNEVECRDLSIRVDNYSACYDTLKYIIYTIKEKFKFSAIDSNLKVELTIILDKYLKKLSIDNPQSLIKVLKLFQNELNEMVKNTSLLDKARFSTLSNNDAKIEDIQNYKMKLIKERSEKENLAKKVSDLEIEEKNTINGGNDNGVF